MRKASLDGFLEEGYSLTDAKELLIRSVQLCKRARSTFQELSPDIKDCYIAASCGPYGAYLADGSEYRGCYGVSKGKYFFNKFCLIPIFTNIYIFIYLFK